MEENKKHEMTSLAYWYPVIEKIAPTPKTIIIPCNRFEIIGAVEGEKLDRNFTSSLVSKADEIGYPLFMRTDLSSGKHDWKNTCYVKDEYSLITNLFRLAEYNELCCLAGMPYKYIVLRQFLNLESSFKAFPGEMPINKERRYFIKDGNIICHHPYWPKEAFYGRPDSEVGWREKLDVLNHETPEEIKHLTRLAEKVGEKLKDFWSIDFAQDTFGVWYLIDMAVGEASYHWEGCPNYTDRLHQ